MGTRVRVVTAPTIEPVLVEEAKTHCRVTEDNEDSLIAIWIRSARVAAENFLRRSLMTQTLEFILDDWPSVPFLLPRPPVQSVSSLKYYATDDTETELSLSTYLQIDTDSEPAIIDLAYGQTWPSTVLRSLAAVKIQYVAGYGANAGSVPEPIRDAIMLYVTHRYENRAAEDGSVPQQFYDLLRPERMPAI